MTDIRDTKFLGFAKLLVHGIMATNAMDVVDAERFLDSDDLSELETLLAQRAYDLVAYALYKARRGCSMEHIDDLTQWPDLRDFE